MSWEVQPRFLCDWQQSLPPGLHPAAFIPTSASSLSVARFAGSLTYSSNAIPRIEACWRQRITSRTGTRISPWTLARFSLQNLPHKRHNGRPTADQALLYKLRSLLPTRGKFLDMLRLRPQHFPSGTISVCLAMATPWLVFKNPGCIARTSLQEPVPQTQIWLLLLCFQAAVWIFGLSTVGSSIWRWVSSGLFRVL
jgi:hypothetical protein